eukprot:CAMPEP_0179426408 /NCGR_PEP_ID=MMETSP0799-20121207/12718_1 /TAXON_ID=46947 /ORGANISM="Geminigera cryophila, Strain CCMP2564" /LENGTH=39 /DNA_ID= /DNA_START= /DNA_END= /DNA_ORIENTATION=
MSERVLPETSVRPFIVILQPKKGSPPAGTTPGNGVAAIW